jgi:hypothetical protein
MKLDYIGSLKIQRWANILVALLITGISGFLSAALTEWAGKLGEIEYPAQEFGRDATYPEGFWLYGAGLFIVVTIMGGLLALSVRNAVITVDGYDKPRGSLRLQIWGFAITGLGIAFSSLNPNLGPLVFMVGLACLVVSFQQKSN